jgi:hypothetical protein
MTYQTVIFFQSDYPARVLETGLSLEEAQAICSDPEASSKTCTFSEKYQKTIKERGHWFIGYRREE